jgi:hypothetical protein
MLPDIRVDVQHETIVKVTSDNVSNEVLLWAGKYIQPQFDGQWMCHGVIDAIKHSLLQHLNQLIQYGEIWVDPGTNKYEATRYGRQLREVV